jgi:hypothetical protein
MREARRAGKYAANRLPLTKMVVEYARTDGFVQVTPKTIVETRRNDNIAAGIPAPTPIKTSDMASRRTALRMARR